MLREISAAYAAKGENRFKIIAYENAADSVEHATSELKDLWEDGKLDTVPGLGKSIMAHIEELFKTGKVKHFEAVKKSLPQGMFELLDLEGFGPKTAYKLAKKLKVKNIKELKEAAKKGKIEGIEGFGKKSQKQILTTATQFKAKSKRHPLPIAFSQAQRVIDHLNSIKECKRIETLGSLRRMVSTIGEQAEQVTEVTEPTEGTEYTIRENDSLSKISEAVYGEQNYWPQLARINNISNPNRILVGNKIQIPAKEELKPIKQEMLQTTYVVQQGDTFFKIAEKMYGDGSKWVVLFRANGSRRLPNGNPLVFAGSTITIPR